MASCLEPYRSRYGVGQGYSSFSGGVSRQSTAELCRAEHARLGCASFEQSRFLRRRGEGTQKGSSSELIQWLTRPSKSAGENTGELPNQTNGTLKGFISPAWRDKRLLLQSPGGSGPPWERASFCTAQPLPSPSFARGWRAPASTSHQRGSFTTDRQRSQLLSSCVYAARDAPTSLRNAIAARDPGGPRSPPAGEVPCAPSPGARRWPAPRRGTPDMRLPASLAASAPLPHSSPMQTRSHPFNKLPRTPINKTLLISPCSEIAGWAAHRNGTFRSSSNGFDHAKLHSILAKLSR